MGMENSETRKATYLKYGKTSRAQWYVVVFACYLLQEDVLGEFNPARFCEQKNQAMSVRISRTWGDPHS